MYADFLDISQEVQQALREGKPVVALESVMVACGLPHPTNLEAGRKCEQILRDAGVVPATIAMLGGRIKVGLSDAELEYIGQPGKKIFKSSRLDLPVLAARKADAATTVCATMYAAHLAGIPIMTAGGLGGVHRGAEKTMDISADLEELANTPVMVVCAGPKAILDLGLTLEFLETRGVPVIGYGTEDFPAFYSRKSGHKANYGLYAPEDVAAAFRMQRSMQMPQGMVVAVPIPEAYAIDEKEIEAVIVSAVREAEEQGVGGKDATPFLLARVSQLTGGESVAANLELCYENCRAAAEIAKALAERG